MSECSKINLTFTISIYICFLFGICIYDNVQYSEVGDWGNDQPLNVTTTQEYQNLEQFNQNKICSTFKPTNQTDSENTVQSCSFYLALENQHANILEQAGMVIVRKQYYQSDGQGSLQQDHLDQHTGSDQDLSKCIDQTSTNQNDDVYLSDINCCINKRYQQAFNTSSIILLMWKLEPYKIAFIIQSFQMEANYSFADDFINDFITSLYSETLPSIVQTYKHILLAQSILFYLLFFIQIIGLICYLDDTNNSSKQQFLILFCVINIAIFLLIEIIGFANAMENKDGPIQHYQSVRYNPGLFVMILICALYILFLSINEAHN